MHRPVLEVAPLAGDSATRTRLLYEATAALAVAGALVLVWRRTRSPAAIAWLGLNPVIGLELVNGGRNDSKNMTIDGVTNLDTGSNGSVHSMPSMDSVAELKLLASNYAAEYGRNAGGTITVITKGGSKQIRGSASWYYRHESLNANDFFNNLAGRDRTPYRYNIAGYTIGGPIVRNKLFFFGGYQGTTNRQDAADTRAFVPTAAMLAGDFTAFASGACAARPITFREERLLHPLHLQFREG